MAAAPQMHAIAGATPDRLAFGNVATGEELVVQRNPTEFTENMGSNYARQAILGLSHELLQYQNTTNYKVAFDLTFDALLFTTREDRYDIMAARRFLMQFHYARRGAQGIRAGAPPRVLVMWPNLLSLSCKLMATANKFTRFQQDGTPTLFTCHLELEEIRDVYLFGDDVADIATLRPASAADQR